MARFYRKRWFLSLIALFVVIGMLFVVLPVAGSMRLVDSQIVSEMEALTGHKVKFSGKPAIGVFPQLHVKLTDLTLTPQSEGATQPIFRADQVRLDLSAWGVINGAILVQGTELIRPELNIPMADNRPLFDRILSGSLYRRLRTAEILVQQSPTAPDLDSIRTFNIGPVSIDGGIVRLLDDNGEEQNNDTLSSINGTLSAVELNGPMRANLTAIWKGENIAVASTIRNVLSLVVGGLTRLQLDVQSAPLTGVFAGNVGLGGHAFAEGALTLSTPSLPRLLEWADQDILVSESIAGLALKANLRARNAQFYFDDAELSLNDKVGTGSIEIVMEPPSPAISATLAFDDLDLTSIIGGLSKTEATERLNMATTEDLSLDLRLSANSALFAPFALQNVAASLQIKPETIAMDINDAELFGGQIQAGLRLKQPPNGAVSDTPNAELKILASDIESAEVSKLGGWENLTLSGPITLSLITQGALDDWASFTNTSMGSITMRAADLAIDGFSLDQLQADLANSQFFPFSFKGSHSISVLEAKGKIDAGNVRIEEFNARIDDKNVGLSGLYAFTAKSLALAGTIFSVNENGERDEEKEETRFFVGGSPQRPFISPIIPGNLPELR